VKRQQKRVGWWAGELSKSCSKRRENSTDSAEGQAISLEKKKEERIRPKQGKGVDFIEESGREVRKAYKKNKRKGGGSRARCGGLWNTLKAEIAEESCTREVGSVTKGSRFDVCSIS